MTRTAPCNETDRDLTAPLEGPISLLWAYQLRREHAQLLERVDSLASAGQNEVVAAEVTSLSLGLKALKDQITRAETDAAAYRLELQNVQAICSQRDEDLSHDKAQNHEKEKQQDKKLQFLEAGQRKLIAQLDHLNNAVLSRSLPKLEEQHELIHQLHGKMLELEDRVTELTEQEVTVVRDSIEDIPLPNFAKPQLVNNSNVSKKIDYSRQKGYVHPIKSLKELGKITDGIRRMHDSRREETPRTRIDVDLRTKSVSEVNHSPERSSREASMMTLPELPRCVGRPRSPDVNEPFVIRQGLTQTWEEYLERGQSLVRASPKRKEGNFVDMFVAGASEFVLRAALERWLDERVWIWQNVESFAVQYQLSEGSREPSSTTSPTPKPQEIVHKKAARKKDGDRRAVAKELIRLREGQDEPGLDPWSRPQSPSGNRNRRSRRLAEKIPMANLSAVNIDRITSAQRRSDGLAADRRKSAVKASNKCKPAAKRPQPSPLNPGSAASAKAQDVLQGASMLEQPTTPKGTDKKPVLPSSPPAFGRSSSALKSASLDAINSGNDSYKVPQDRITSFQTTYKRKLEPPGANEVVNNKKAKTARKKRGPPPPIPILPSSDD